MPSPPDGGGASEAAGHTRPAPSVEAEPAAAGRRQGKAGRRAGCLSPSGSLAPSLWRGPCLRRFCTQTKKEPAPRSPQRRRCAPGPRAGNARGHRAGAVRESAGGRGAGRGHGLCCGPSRRGSRPWQGGGGGGASGGRRGGRGRPRRAARAARRWRRPPAAAHATQHPRARTQRECTAASTCRSIPLMSNAAVPPRPPAA